MSMMAGPEEQVERGHGAGLPGAEGGNDGEAMGRGEGSCYRGSWAEQRVAARLATNRTRKATRMTTTPPTVRRSQRSELLRWTNSCFPVIAVALHCHSTVLANVCCDQDHKPAVWRMR